ncbi:MAG: helix-turn-helix transcriptional regulator [Treponema sp.]
MTCDDIKKRLGENVKRIRKEQKLTQFQLAEKAELSEETVKNIELSRCWTSDKNLAKLTKALEVDIHSLFLPVSTSFENDSKDSAIIKNAIADNLKDYVNSVLKEITQN